MPTYSTTYYTPPPCNTNLVVGCRLYSDINYQNAVSPGYYSDGVYVYEVTGTLGIIATKTTCSITPNPNCTACCFVGNTLISLKDGSQKSIKNILPGDVILSFNESKDQIEEDKVVSKIGRITNDIVRYIFTNGVMIESTKDHPYYVNGLKIASLDPITTTDKYGFEIDVDMIKVGDVVNLEDGSTTVIESIEELDSLEQVYTLEVEHNHNFYANGVLVHNKTSGCSCCYNVVTGQHQQVPYNTDSQWCGCKCLGANWVDSPGSCNGC